MKKSSASFNIANADLKRFDKEIGKYNIKGYSKTKIQEIQKLWDNNREDFWDRFVEIEALYKFVKDKNIRVGKWENTLPDSRKSPDFKLTILDSTVFLEVKRIRSSEEEREAMRNNGSYEYSLTEIPEDFYRRDSSERKIEDLITDVQQQFPEGNINILAIRSYRAEVDLDSIYGERLRISETPSGEIQYKWIPLLAQRIFRTFKKLV